MAKGGSKISPAKTKGNFRKEIPLAKRGKMAASSRKAATYKSHGRAKKSTRDMPMYMAGS